MIKLLLNNYVIPVICTLMCISFTVNGQALEFIESAISLTVNENDSLLNNPDSYALYFPGEETPSFFQFDSEQIRLIQDLDTSPVIINWQVAEGYFDAIMEYLSGYEYVREIYYFPRINGDYFELSITLITGITPDLISNSIFASKDLNNNSEWVVEEESSLQYPFVSTTDFFPIVSISMNLNNDNLRDWLLLGAGSISSKNVYASNDGWEHGNINIYSQGPVNTAYNIKDINIINHQGNLSLIGGYETFVHGEYSHADFSSKIFMIQDFLSDDPVYTEISGNTESAGVVSEVGDELIMADRSSISYVTIENNGNEHRLLRSTMFAGPFNLAGIFWNENSNLIQDIFVYDEYNTMGTYASGNSETTNHKLIQRWEYNSVENSYSYRESFPLPANGRVHASSFSTRLASEGSNENALIVHTSSSYSFSRDNFLLTYKLNDQDQIFIDSTLYRRSSDTRFPYFLGNSNDNSDLILLLPATLFNDYFFHFALSGWDGVEFQDTTSVYIVNASQHGALADWDGNGTKDLLSGNTFFKNNDQTSFPVEIYEEILIDQLPENSKDWTIFDYQNDGLPDILTEDGRLFINTTQSSSIKNNDYEISDFTILNTYPNPFNSTLNIVYQLEYSQSISFNLHNLLGQQVLSSRLASKAAGNHVSTINTESLASGVYLLRAETSRQNFETRKVILLK